MKRLRLPASRDTGVRRNTDLDGEDGRGRGNHDAMTWTHRSRRPSGAQAVVSLSRVIQLTPAERSYEIRVSLSLGPRPHPQLRDPLRLSDRSSTR
jgi:hypothetical protein